MRRVTALLALLPAHAWFAYGSVLALQAKVVWNIWRYRDLTFGDTSSYFINALDWFQRQQNPFAWSPLYTTFYGTLLHLVPDAYSATLLHRLILVFGVSLLVLALMRRLLPPAIALLVTVWWVVMPINFDTMYEVHLFAVLPTLLAFIVATRPPSSTTRGAVLGILLAASALVRNELILALGFWAVTCLVGETAERRRHRKPLRVYLVAYGLPTLLALGLSLFFYARSQQQGAQLQAALEDKHTLGVCHTYAVNYQQRRSDWQLNPWMHCDALLERDFGARRLSMGEAIRRNPRAMADFFLWNLRLVPAGVQKLLFGSTTDVANPDYARTKLGDPMASLYTLAFLAVVFVGGRRLWRERGYWWEAWLEDRYMGWVAMSCAVVTVVAAMLTQRPRPSYMFNLSYWLFAVLGMAIHAIVNRGRRLEWLSAVAPLVIAGAIIGVPPYYTATYDNVFGFQGRPIMTAYRRLEPFAALFRGRKFGVNPFSSTLCSYLVGGECTGLSYEEIMSDRPADVPVAVWLAQKEIRLLYIDETHIDDPTMRSFLETLGPVQWEVVVDYRAADGRWMLIQRRRVSDAAARRSS